MTSSPEVILQTYLNYLRRNVTRKLLPGEGSKIVKLVHEVILFVENTKMSLFALDNMTNTVLLIVDEILLYPNSLTQANVSTKYLNLLSMYFNLVDFKTNNKHFYIIIGFVNKVFNNKTRYTKTF